ncbi:hypothetical protein D3C84_650830 [compost metagenome]
MVIGQLGIDGNVIEQIVQLGLFTNGEIRGTHIAAGDLHIVDLRMHVIVKQDFVPILELDSGKIFVRQVNREGAVGAVTYDPDVTHFGEGERVVDQL